MRDLSLDSHKSLEVDQGLFECKSTVTLSPICLPHVNPLESPNKIKKSLFSISYFTNSVLTFQELVQW